MDRFEYLTRAKNSVSRHYRDPEMYPSHIRGCFGAHVVDASGKSYVDYMCGDGTNLLGYGNPYIARALIQKLSSGMNPSLPSTDEIFAAEKLKELFPFVEMFRFFKTTEEASQFADALSHIYSGKYANTVKPVHHNIGKENTEVLGRIREKCDTEGRLLCFDETESGFRYKNFAASNTHGVLPDLIILGKAIANGFPIAAVGGKKEVMKHDADIGNSEYCGEVLSLVAVREAGIQYQTNFDLKELWSAGEMFVKGFNDAAEGVVNLKGYATCGHICGERRNVFFAQCAKAGILFGTHWYFNPYLIKETEKTLNTVRDICNKLNYQKGEL